MYLVINLSIKFRNYGNNAICYFWFDSCFTFIVQYLFRTILCTKNSYTLCIFKLTNIDNRDLVQTINCEVKRDIQ